MNITKVPDRFRYMSADEVAECVSGIKENTYAELWKAVSESEKAGTDKPPGGDGSNGTFEEPVITDGEYGTDLVSAWKHLSEEARINICECAEALEKSDPYPPTPDYGNQTPA